MGVVLLVVIAGAGYYYMNSGYEVISVDIINPGESGVIGQDIIILAERLNSLSIDTTIFSDPLLTNLEDFSMPLFSESQGRPNPFAPIGIDVASAAFQAIRSTRVSNF